jgi:hypothetical protein
MMFWCPPQIPNLAGFLALTRLEFSYNEAGTNRGLSRQPVAWLISCCQAASVPLLLHELLGSRMSCPAAVVICRSGPCSHLQMYLLRLRCSSSTWQPTRYDVHQPTASAKDILRELWLS